MKIISSFFFLFFFTSALWAQPLGQLITAGDTLDKENRNQEALALYLRADGQKPNDAEIQWRLSKQYSQLMADASSVSEKRQLSQMALKSAQRAVSLDPTNAQAHLSLAIVYGRIALNESARRKVEMSRLIRQEAETAARLDPKNDYAWHVLGRWNYEIANFNPVLKALAQTVYGKLPEASNEKAVACFSKAIALQPRRVSHHVGLGRAYLALGEKQKARDEFNKAISLPSVDKDDPEDKQRAQAMLKELR
jgi:tetratricopeptide (TPR) repeat protein